MSETVAPPAGWARAAFGSGAAAAGLPSDSPVSIAARCASELFAEAAQVDRADGFPSVSIELLRSTGMLAAPLRVQHGGADLERPSRLLQLLRVLAHLGRGSLAVGRLYEGHVNAIILVYAFGSDACVARCAADASAGHLFGVWNTEGRRGVTLLEDEGGRARLCGSKTFASGAGHVSRAVVTATDPRGGRQMLVVDGDALAHRIDRSSWQPLGMLPTASFEVDLDALDVDAADRVGGPGDFYREPVFSGGAVRFAAVQLGGAEAMFDAARGFLRRLGRTDDPYQRSRMGEMAMLFAGGRHWLGAAAAQAGELDPSADGNGTTTHPQVAFAHLMRSAVEEACLRVMRLAERSVGARGLLRPEPFERLHRDLTTYLRQANPDAAVAEAGAYVLARDDVAPQLWAG